MENHVLRKKHIMNIHRLAWDLQRSDVSRLQKVRIATVPRLGCHMQTFRRLIIMLLLVWIPYWTTGIFKVTSDQGEIQVLLLTLL